MTSKKARARAAARAAKRLPIVGTAVVLSPALRAASNAFPSAANIGSFANWKDLGHNLIAEFTGIDSATGTFNTNNLIRTYGPIGVYLLTRRFAGKHISRVLKPLGLRF